MYLTARENDIIQILLCKHDVFNDYKNEVISLLQVKFLPLPDDDMLPLCLLGWTLDEECGTIDSVPTNVMTAMTTVDRRGVWFGFLPTLFVKWTQQKYK